jgi:hypothetical protein
VKTGGRKSRQSSTGKGSAEVIPPGLCQFFAFRRFTVSTTNPYNQYS